MRTYFFCIWTFSLALLSQGVAVDYLRAYDGDTIFVDIPQLKENDPNGDFSLFWSGISVRIAGIDVFS